jgi:IS1 family transposase
MNRLSIDKRAQIIGLLVEGNSLRATSRITGFALNTVMKLLVDLGAACSEYQDKVLRNLPCKRIQCDEIWSFVYAKQKNLPASKKNVPGFGDTWTWTALDADTKLVPSWYVGSRDAEAAAIFLNDLASRLSERPQITTDGHKVYLRAVEEAFGVEVDYAMLVKLYGADPQAMTRYSPAECIGAFPQIIAGRPNLKHVSTSFVERSNLTLRMGQRRFTRLTNAHSKKIQNLEAAVSLHFQHYNFARIHSSLRVTPAMEAGISNHVWTLEEIAALTN